MATARAPHPHWLQALVASLIVVAFIALYIAALRLTLDYSRDSVNHTANERDTVYFGIHGAVLVIGTLAGFAAGKWLNGMGVAYAALVFVAIVLLMVATQAGAQTLACHGRNDIVKHWTC